MNAKEKLLYKNEDYKFVCIGLDPDLSLIPEFILKEKEPIYFFNKKIIEATKSHAAAYKINFAFYEIFGAYGFELINKIIDEIPSDIITIADAKRGDIANSSINYAKSIFEHFNFDAITLNPFMGFDSIEPFLNYSDKLNFILGLTSNSGANDFEKLELINGQKLFQFVIDKIVLWNKTYNNCGIVFGATNLNELIENLFSMNNCSLLIPGVGKQGGSFSDTLIALHKFNRNNFLINLSRSIIYLDSSLNFQKTIEMEIQNLNKISKEIFI